jgi:hypothetical protein
MAMSAFERCSGFGHGYRHFSTDGPMLLDQSRLEIERGAFVV